LTAPTTKPAPDIGQRQVGWPSILGVLLACQLAAAALVIAAEMVPDRLVADALVEGVDKGLVIDQEYPVTGLGNRADRWSECVALTIGLGDPPESHNLQTAFSSPSLGRCATAVPRLVAYSESHTLEAQRFYFRYWHGYTILTRPGLAAIGVGGTRLLAMAAAAAAIAVLTAAVAGSTSASLSAALVVPFVLTTDFFDLGESTPHAIVVATTWVLAATLWSVLADPPTLLRLVLVGSVTGAVSSFFEFMFLIPGTLALLGTMCAMRLWMHGRRRGNLWAGTLVFGSSWFVSFAATWALKWVAASWVLGPEVVIQDIGNQIFNRIGGDSLLVVDAFGAAVSANLGAWLERPLAPIVVPLIVIVLLSLSVVVVSRRRAIVDYLTLLVLIAAVPFAWFEAVSNHSQIHFWFTYRALPIAAGALMAGLALPLIGKVSVQSAVP
jgi:hypothetical protein